VNWSAIPADVRRLASNRSRPHAGTGNGASRTRTDDLLGAMRECGSASVRAFSAPASRTSLAGAREGGARMVADHRQSLSTWALAAGLVPSHLSARGRSLVPLGPAPGTASVALSGGERTRLPACPPGGRLAVRPTQGGRRVPPSPRHAAVVRASRVPGEQVRPRGSAEEWRHLTSATRSVREGRPRCAVPRR
jgi:hypothetical protein